MIRKVIAILFLTLTVISFNQQWFVYLTYQLNKSYVAAYLCENNLTIETLCNGRCVLVDGYEIIGDYNDSPTNSSFSIEKAELTLFWSDFKSNENLVNTSITLDDKFFLPFYDFHPIHTLLKPPQYDLFI